MNRHFLQSTGRLVRRSIGTSQIASNRLSASTFSSAAPQPESSDSPTPVPVDLSSFHYPKARAVFEKIISKCSKDDVRRLSEETSNILGRPMRPNEFYYVGFGSNKRGSAGAEDATAAAAPPVKTTVDLKLVGFDAKMKIKVIKEIRAVAGLGLKEAKELVEGAPKTVQKGLKPEAAEELKKKLEEVGAVIELV